MGRLLPPLVALSFFLPGTVTLARNQAATPIHVLKIAGGPSGSEVNGTFVLSSERSIFNRQDDREIVVHFLWEGNPGPHKLVGQWRSPDGTLTSNSTIDYVAKAQRFGAYWTLPLTPSMPLGTWSIEALVDGVPAGRFSFEVTDIKVTAISKKLLTQPELYERLNRALVVLRRSSKVGRLLEAGAGFSRGDGSIFTALSNVDGADDIRAVSADGSETVIMTVLAFNRKQGWVVLSGGGTAENLPSAGPDAVHVGARCFSMQGAGATGRAFSECTVSGRDAGTTPPSLIATFVVGSADSGAPVVNESGELVGIVRDRAPIMRFGARSPGTAILPLDVVKIDPGVSPVTLNDLRSRGLILQSVVGDEHIMTSGFGRVDSKGKLLAAEHQDEFSVREKGFAVFVIWSPKDRVRGQLKLQVFDAENKLLVESKPSKIDARKGVTSTSTWSVPMPTGPGIFRADVMLDASPVWRRFVRITP